MYNVGQTLYTVLTEKHVVVPVKVVEQVTIKTLDGEKTNYKLLLPNTKQQKVSIDKFTNLHIDINSVKEYLTKNAKSAIDKMIEDAETLRSEFFKEEINTCKNELDVDIINQDQNNNVIKVDLENGQKANINIDNINNFINNGTQENSQKKT